MILVEGMPPSARGLDHVIHLVRDLDAAGEAYARLGFLVGPENRHPFGTTNRIVQLPGFFIELLSIGDHAPIPEHGPNQFSFAAFHRDRLSRLGEGGSGLAVESRDAEADARAFEAAGVGGFETFAFERKGVGPSGSPVEVGFELAFAVDPASSAVCFFACEHKRPQNFWSAAAQAHPNGAIGVGSAMFTAENPSDHHIFFDAFTGMRDFRASSSGVAFDTPRGAIEILIPAAFAQRIGEPAAETSDVRLSALRLLVADLDQAEAASQGLAERRGNLLVTPASHLFGLTLVLEEATYAA
ncbi:MAG TPA: VOC family protein [Hansschlegelia sp.]